MLYILAKGGQTVYSGRPRDLRQHLTDCHIICTENQIPIEVIIKLCANGLRDEAVIQMSAKTNEYMNNTNHKRLNRELKLQSNGIPIETKVFSLQEFMYLLMRALTVTVRHNWKLILIQYYIQLMAFIFLKMIFPFNIEGSDGCIDLYSNETYCVQTEQSLKSERMSI